MGGAAAAQTQMRKAEEEQLKATADQEKEKAMSALKVDAAKVDAQNKINQEKIIAEKEKAAADIAAQEHLTEVKENADKKERTQKQAVDAVSAATTAKAKED